MNDSLPLGWSNVLVSALAELHCGQSPPVAAVNANGKGTPYVTGPDQWRSGTLVLEKWTTQPKRIVPDGCIFVTVKGAGVGTTFPGVACAIGRDVYAIQPHAGLNRQYIHLALDFDIRTLIDQAAGLIPGLSRDHLLSQEIPLPPIGEQHRIVEKLQSLMPRVSAARKRLESVPRILRRFRQVALAAACEGRLTADWRSQASGGPSLGEPPDWTPTTVGDLSSLVTSGSRGWAKYYSEDGPLFIRSQDINTDRLSLADIVHVRPPVGSEGVRTRAKQDDLLITITGANVTKTAIIGDPIPEAYVSQHVALVRLKDPGLSRWLHLWLLSRAHGRRQLLESAYGAGKPGLNLENVRDVTLELPPEGERKEILRRVQVLLSLADSLERRVNAAQSDAERLPQAILARAFAGELVPTEASLARAEGRSYETATKLLERLSVEREASAQRNGVHRRTGTMSAAARNRKKAKSRQ